MMGASIMHGLPAFAQALADAAGELPSVKSSYGRLDLARAPLETIAPSMRLEPFGVSSLGNFPYYWEVPSNLLFNPKTYVWISAGLKRNANPVELDQPFTNTYIDALAPLVYELSESDSQQLEQARSKITTQQGQLLAAWRQSFGSLPPSKQPIDTILATISQEWASPPTTLQEMQDSLSLSSMLNKTPASGKAILPALANYLAAIGDSVSLLDAVTRNNGYKAMARRAAQCPSSDNGGLQIDGQSNLVPKFVVNTPLQEIVQGLNSATPRNSLTRKMSLRRSSRNEYDVSPRDGPGTAIPLTVPTTEFLRISRDAKTDVLSDLIATDGNPVDVDVSFTGVTMVYFGPAPFSQATRTDWYWMTPITNAIANRGKTNVTGFKFRPDPGIDFGKTGPFGFLTAVAISKNPSLRVATRRANYQEIARTLEAAGPAALSFLGKPMGSLGEKRGYEVSVTTDSRKEAVQLNFSPSAQIADDTVDSTAYVLGVQTNYPAA
jgi:hypothetical protein